MTDRPLTVVVPMVPPVEVMPNSRAPRFVPKRDRQRGKLGTVEARRLFREAAYFACLNPILSRGEPMPLFVGPVRCVALIAWPNERRRCDPDNAIAGLKALIDGLADTGMFGADDRRLIHHPVEQTVDPDGAGYVAVTLWQDGDEGT